MRSKLIEEMLKRKSILTLGRVDEPGSDQVIGKEKAGVDPIGSWDLQPYSLELPNFSLSGGWLLDFT